MNVPVERLTSKAYAEERRKAIDVTHAQKWGAGIAQLESADTTHMTAADAFGNVVATTQTINNLFGAKILIPGLGTIPNNYMHLYDPRPGHALSLAPGKRVTTSMSPMMALRNGKLVYALGLPGGKRIFPSAMQALINLIDHGMSLQEAVEAPRVWTEGNALEVELAVPDAVRAALISLGHKVLAVPTVAGRVDAIGLEEITYSFGCHQHGLRRRYAVGGACDLNRLQQCDAGKSAVAVKRGRAGKTGRRRGRQRDIAAAAKLGHRSLDAGHRGAAALVLRIGNACEVERRLRGGVGEIERFQPARAIDAQQREIVLLVLGDAIGIAKARDHDREAAVGDLAVGDDRAVVADDDAG